MAKISALTGREYHIFQYYGDPEAEDVIVAMGSVCGTIEETVDALRASGRKVGLVQVRLYRPFSRPSSSRRTPCKCATHRSARPLRRNGLGGRTALRRRGAPRSWGAGRAALVVGGRYGLSSKDTDPTQIRDVFDNLRRPEPLNHFSIGIVDDVTHLSLPRGEALDTDRATFS